MYTMWSSEPDTIHYEQEKYIKIFSVYCPYILLIMTHLKLINLIIAPFHLLQRSSRRCNTFRFCGRCTFSGISLYYNPTASMCCLTLLPGCICRSAKIWQTTLEDYHHLSEFLDIVLTRYPKFDWKLRVSCDINIISKHKSEYLQIESRKRKNIRHYSFHRFWCHITLTINRRNYLKRLKSHPYWNAPRLQDLNVPARF